MCRPCMYAGRAVLIHSGIATTKEGSCQSNGASSTPLSPPSSLVAIICSRLGFTAGRRATVCTHNTCVTHAFIHASHCRYSVQQDELEAEGISLCMQYTRGPVVSFDNFSCNTWHHNRYVVHPKPPVSDACHVHYTIPRTRQHVR